MDCPKQTNTASNNSNNNSCKSCSGNNNYYQERTPSSSVSTVSSVSSLSTSSNDPEEEEEENDVVAVSLQEDYETIEMLLRRAQDDLSTISASPVLEEMAAIPASKSDPSTTCENLVISSSDNYLDFLTMFEQSNPGAGLIKPNKPERPGTLSRPVVLPTCCKFKAKPWHSLINGDYSYSKFTPGNETQLESSTYKKDLDDIMREFQSYLKRDKNGNVGKFESSALDVTESAKTRSLSKSPTSLLRPSDGDFENINKKMSGPGFKERNLPVRESLDTRNNNISEYRPLQVDRNFNPVLSADQCREYTNGPKIFQLKNECSVDRDQFDSKIKRRSRTVSPSSAVSSALNISKTDGACDSKMHRNDSSAAFKSSQVDGSNLNNIRKKSHYAGLKTNGCLKNRDPVAIQNKANEILLQRYMNKSNPSNHWPSTTFNPFDYKISLSTPRRVEALSQDSSRVSSSDDLQITGGRRSSNPSIAKKSRLSKENLLDKLHRTLYPGLYKNASSNSLSTGCNKSTGRRASLDNNNLSSPASKSLLLCSKSFVCKNQDILQGKLRPVLTKTSYSARLNGDLLAKGSDCSRSLPVTPSKDNNDAADQKLLQTSWWLILSGFPQYVQVYKDDKLPISLSQLVEDHCFLEADELAFLKKRVQLLNHMATKKLSISPSLYSKMTSFQEFQHCLSCQWTYDKLTCSWLRTASDRPATFQISRASTKESLSSSSPSTSASSSSSSTVSATANQTSKTPEEKPQRVAQTRSASNDNNSLHLTSGYESEVSPVSTNVFLRDAAEAGGVSSIVAEDNRNFEASGIASTNPLASSSISLRQCHSHAHDRKQASFLKTLSRNSEKGFHSHGHIGDARAFAELPIRNRKRSGFYGDVCPSEELDGNGDAQTELDMILKEFYRDIGEYGFNIHSINNNNNNNNNGNNNDDISNNNNNSEELHSPAARLVEFSKQQQQQPSSSAEHDDHVFNPSQSQPPLHADDQLRMNDGEPVSMNRLSVSQFAVLKKLVMLKLSGIFDRFGLQSDFLSSIEKNKELPAQPQEKKLFGVPPYFYLRKSGKFLPPSIVSLIDFIESSSPDCVGIFRKPGVQSRIQSLQKLVDINPEEKLDTSLEVDPYDAADVFKRYMRDLPESLFTESLCASFSLIFSNLPSTCAEECLQSLLLLLPDVNRCILFQFFHFLHRISRHSHLNQMTPANLAVCFLPSLFRMNESSLTPMGPASSSSSSNVLPTSGLSWDHKSALICLTQIIEKPHAAFSISQNIVETANRILTHLSTFSFVDSNLRIHSLDQMDSPDYASTFLFASMKNFNKFRGWNQVKSKDFPDASISMSSERNGSFVPSWKCQVEILAPPVEVLNKIHKDSQPWVGLVTTQKVVERKIVEDDRIHHEIALYEFLLPDALLFEGSLSDEQFISTNSRQTCELRAWKTDLPKESCFYCSKSVLKDPGKSGHEGGPCTVHMTESSFFLEPCGEGLTSLTHVSTIDLIGHSTDWYEMAFPPIILGYFTDLQQFFKQKIADTSGPETKV